jgi:hypothetical protein
MLDEDFIIQLLDENTDLRIKNMKLEKENTKLRQLLQGLHAEVLIQSLRRKVHED